MLTILEREGSTEKLSMLRSHGDKDGMPWYSVFLGYPVLGIWYWCADQTIVQRVLGAKNEWHARQGPVFAGVLKIPGGFMMMAFTLFMICVIAQMVLSLVWPDKAAVVVEGEPRGAELAWETPRAALKISSGRGLSDPRFSSAGLVAVMLVLYWLFR